MNQRQISKEMTRQRLIQVGLELFSQNGFEQTSALDITRAAGVAVGTLYMHFGDKEGLLEQVIIDATQEIYQRGENRLQSSRDSS